MESQIFAEQILNIAKSILSEKEFDIVYSRTLHNVSRNELAKDYNVTAERIRQIEAKALRKLFNNLKPL